VRSDAARSRNDGRLVAGRSRRLARAVLSRLPGFHHAAAIEHGLTVRRNSRRVGREGIVRYPQAERLWYLPHPPNWTTEAIFSDGTRMRVHLRGERFYRDLNGWLSFDLYRDAWHWLAPLGVRDVLDCASGSGYGAVLLREWGAASVLGVDVDQECIEYAQHRYQLAGVAFMAGDAERLEGVADASVQAVVSIETIEHVRNAEACLAQFQRVLQPGGSLYLTTPDGTDRAHSGNPFHHKEYSARELLTLLRARFASVDVESVESRLIARCRGPLADATRSEGAH
jgi:ubiquinone/menaquinone biosynthesis C-methylase UbiE